MPIAYKIGMVYLAVVNAAAFCAFGMDKRKAIKGKWRIPERTLLLLALAGGSAGALLGMLAFRHKTQKKKFTIGIPVILLLHLCIAYCIIRWRFS